MSETGALSIAQAVEELNRADSAVAVSAENSQTKAAPEAAAEQTNPPSAPGAAGNEIPADTGADGSEAETPGDAEIVDDETGAEAPPIEPPRWWSKDKKEKFAALPPELQAVVFEQEDVRERVVSKAKQDSAEARKAAESEAAEFKRRAALLDQVLPGALKAFRDKWTGIDWAALPAKVGAAEAFRMKAEFDREQDGIRAMTLENQRIGAERQQEFLLNRSEKLKSIAPDLTGDAAGLQRQAEVINFLAELGMDRNTLVNTMTADQTAVAYDAMRWRRAQAQTAALAKNPKTAPQPARPHVRSSAAPAARSPETARLKELEGRFASDPSIKNLTALMNAKGN